MSAIYGSNRGLLVRSLLEREAPLETAELPPVHIEGVAAARGATREYVEQLRRHVEGLLRRLAPRPQPLLPPEAVQGRELGVDAGVAAHQVKRGDGHVELVPALVLEAQILTGDSPHVQGDEAPIAAHAVVLVHDRGPRRELREIAHQALGVASASAPPPALHRPLSEELRFGHDRDGGIAQPCALLERRHGDAERCVAFHEGLPVPVVHGPDAGGGERVPQVLAPSRALRDHQRAPFGLREETREGLEGFARVRVDRHAHGNAGVVGGEAAPGLLLESSEPHLRTGLQSREGLVDGEEEFRGREKRTFPVVPAALEALLRLEREALGGLVHVFVQDREGVIRKVVEESGGALEEQRQVVLDSRRAAAFAHLAVDGAVLRIAFESRTPGAPESRDGDLREGVLPRGQQPHPVEALGRTLGLGVEGTDAVDLVVEEIDAQGMRGAAGKEIEEGAAHRELAVIHDLADAPVAEALQARPGLVQIEALSGGQHHGAAVHELRRRPGGP